MKTKLIFVLIGAVILGVTSIIRLASSDVLEGSPTELAATAAAIVIILALIAFFLVRSFKAKLRYLKDMRSDYNAAYLCMIESDLTNLYILASTDTDLILFKNDKKKSVVVELKKKFIDITVTDVARGFRNGKGIRISTKSGFSQEITPSTNITLLDDTKVILTPPLKDAELLAAHANLTRS